MAGALKVVSYDTELRDVGVMLVSRGREVLALDPFGDVVWRKDMPFEAMGCALSLQRTVLVVSVDGRIGEFGLNGEFLHQWSSARRGEGCDFGVVVDAGRLQGSVEEIAPDVYLSSTDENTVLVFDRRGKVLWEWRLRDLIDPAVVGDGGQVNCAVMDPTDGGVLLALADLGVVVKVSRRGDLVWVLGDVSGWAAPWAGKVLTQDGGIGVARPSDVNIAANGEVMVFDRGAAHMSYVRAFRIDAAAMAASARWGMSVRLCENGGSVCETPSGNRFVVGRELLDIQGRGNIVFHAEWRDSDAQGYAGRAAYLSPELAGKLCSKAEVLGSRKV